MVLTIGRLRLRTNKGGIEQAKTKPISGRRRGACGVGRGAWGVGRGAWGVGRKNRFQGNVGGKPRFPGTSKIGCVAKTHLDAERCVVASSTHPTGFSRPVAAPAFQPMDTQLNVLPTLPVLARTVSGCVKSAFLNKSQHFTVHLFRPWIPSSARGSDGGLR